MSKPRKSKTRQFPFDILRTGTSELHGAVEACIADLVEGKADFIRLDFRFHGLKGWRLVRVRDPLAAYYRWKGEQNCCEVVHLLGNSVILSRIDMGQLIGRMGIARVSTSWDSGRLRRHAFVASFLQREPFHKGYKLGLNGRLELKHGDSVPNQPYPGPAVDFEAAKLPEVGEQMALF